MAAALAAAAAHPAFAEGAASAWVTGFNNKARIIAGRAVDDGNSPVYAGIQIEMTPGWKTYWRTPGEAGGVPPEFDWSASENLAEAKVLYPAPHRLIDKAGATIGYKDHVLFPVLLTAKDPAQPVKLKLKAAYGVCEKLCVPAEAELELSVEPQAGLSGDIATALAAVPRTAPVAASDPIVKSWALETRGGKPILVFDATDPAGSMGDAFADAAGGVYVPLPKKVSGSGGSARYEVDLSDGADYKDLQGKPLAITLTGAKGQSETSITLP